ncbi:glycosyltransferase [Neomicrococcus aestuarii]
MRVVEANEKRGSAYVRNAGVTKAKGDVIAFCDADDQVGVGWLQAA